MIDELVPTQQEYEIFELLVGRRMADGYPVTISHSLAGETSDICALDPAAHDIRIALECIEAGTTDAVSLIGFGRNLFNALFPQPIATLYRASLSLAREQGKGLLVRLRIEPSELGTLPWEYLYDSEEECFLSISPEIPLVRYVPMPHRCRPTAVHPPLRVLLVLSDPEDTPRLDVDREKSLIEKALSEWIDRGLVQLDCVKRGLASEICQAMRAFRPHVFHFVGHGQCRGDDAYVVLEDEDRRAQPVGSRIFREFFIGIADTRLAVLNACQLASTSSTGPLAGLAPQLLQRNLSAVVAMQHPISDRTALIFSREFYRSLALGYPVEGAMAEARKGIFLETAGDAQSRSRDWGIPVLFLRAQDGRLFELVEEKECQSEVPPPPEPIQPPRLRGFVGREAELAYYADKLKRRHLAVITGMPGAGKTSLAVMLSRQAREPGKVFWHTFHAGESIEEVIWKLCGFLYWQGHRELWQMLQQIQQVGGQCPPPAVLLDYLFQALRGQDYLLCLDDLDFVEDDPLMGQFLARMCPTLREGEAAMIVTSQCIPSFVRSDEFQVLSGLSLEDTVKLLACRGLPMVDAEAARKAVHTTDELQRMTRLMSTDLIANLHDRTEGNPLFLALIANALRDTSTSVRSLFRLFETEDIEHFLMHEIDDSLTEVERLVMSAMSILMGYSGTRRALEAILDGESVRRTLGDLRQRHLVNVRKDEEGRKYKLNALLRYFYYDSLSQRRRREMHRRAGMYYDTEEPDALKAALHLEAAGEADWAARVVTAKVDLLISQGHARPLCLLLESIKAHPLDGKQKALVAIARGQAHEFLGEKGRATDSYNEALSTARQIGCQQVAEKALEKLDNVGASATASAWAA